MMLEREDHLLDKVYMEYMMVLPPVPCVTIVVIPAYQHTQPLVCTGWYCPVHTGRDRQAVGEQARNRQGTGREQAGNRQGTGREQAG